MMNNARPGPFCYANDIPCGDIACEACQDALMPPTGDAHDPDAPLGNEAPPLWVWRRETTTRGTTTP